MIYLDSASTSYYKPDTVTHAVADAMENYGNYGRGAHPAAMAANRGIYAARRILAPFFGAAPGQLAFTHNATAALNMAIFGLLSGGGHAITTVLEHNSVLRPLYQLQNRGLALDFVGLAPDYDLNYDDFAKLLRPETVCVIATHCSNLTGNVTNLSFIAEFCKRHGLILIVDAAQSAGLFPMDIGSLGDAAVCFTGHKGFMGPQGTGGLVSNNVEIPPMFVGGTGSDSFAREHPRSTPESLEAGTLNAHGIAGLAAGAEYITQKGIAFLRNESLALSQVFAENVAKIDGVNLLCNPELRQAPIVSANIGDLDSAQAEAIFAMHGICVRGGFHCAPLAHRALGTDGQGAVRFSFSSFNTVQHVEVAIHTVAKIAREYA